MIRCSRAASWCCSAPSKEVSSPPYPCGLPRGAHTAGRPASCGATAAPAARNPAAAAAAAFCAVRASAKCGSLRTTPATAVAVSVAGIAIAWPLVLPLGIMGGWPGAGTGRGTPLLPVLVCTHTHKQTPHHIRHLSDLFISDETLLSLQSLRIRWRQVLLRKHGQGAAGYVHAPEGSPGKEV